MIYCYAAPAVVLQFECSGKKQDEGLPLVGEAYWISANSFRQVLKSGPVNFSAGQRHNIGFANYADCLYKIIFLCSTSVRAF